jgi:serine protease Do
MNTKMSQVVRLLGAATVCFTLQSARAQTVEPATKDQATLVIEGVVREVFQSARADRIDYLVQIDVARTEAVRAPRTAPRVAVPAPGELVYVHVSGPAGQRLAGNDVRSLVPAERTPIRAYVVAGADGGWKGAASDWFQTTAADVAEGAAPPSGAGAAPATDRRALSSLGFTAESLNVKGQLVLRVTSVEQGGPAQRSGLEPGDIVVGANESNLSRVEDLERLARQGTLKTLVVLDVNNGKAVRVPFNATIAQGSNPLNPTQPDETRPATPAPTDPGRVPAAPASGRSLGIAAEPVRVGERTGMKVTRVEPTGPAGKAGIEPGDVIVAANNVPITGVEVLSSVVRKSSAKLVLTVRDTRTGKDVPVEVKLPGPDISAPAQVPSDPRIQTESARKFGALTEVVFYDVDPAVKVTEVEPNSPAARAGIQPGDIIVEANGTPVLHPKTLDEVVRKSGAILKLTVVKSRTNQKAPVDVKLDSDR